MNSHSACNDSVWTKEQNKAFENAIALYYGEPDDRWEKIAAAITGKTRDEIKRHYEYLVEDITAIESGLVPLPCYAPSSNDTTKHAGGVGIDEKGNQVFQRGSDSGGGKRSSRRDQERRKGMPWTEEEHKLFLRGLEKYGKGDWKSISRNFVVSRTPTQVASHAQKYFIRLNSTNKERRRSSIHDITSVDDGETSAPPGSITGQMNVVGEAGYSTMVGISQPYSALAPAPAPAPVPVPVPVPAPSVFVPSTFGQPIQGPFVSALGASVNFPSPVQPMYDPTAPNPESLIPGTSTNMDPMNYYQMPGSPYLF